MLILSIDSAASACAACVWQDGNIQAIAEEKMQRGQDQRLLPVIGDVMKQAGVEFEDFDRISVIRGPGSFTGLRIGLAAARGLGLAAARPVVGIDRFSIYHHEFGDAKDVLVVIQSHRSELFCQFYPKGETPPESEMLSLNEIKDFCNRHPSTVIVGDVDVLPELQLAIHPEVLTCAELAALVDCTNKASLPRPLYLRPPDVTLGPVIPVKLT
jgi:tRNA threonylcarbamoyladenosine biosynthesis protein TsaB